VSQAIRTLAFALLAWGLCACAHGRLKGRAADAGVTVEAEGWAAIVSEDPLGTARRALAEAQRKAVERVSGVSLRARTRVDQAVAVEQRIWADAAGRILSYEILGEHEEGSFHKTRIRAVVLKRDNRIGASGSEPLPGDPKMAVALKAGSFSDKNAAEQGLRQALREAGISVVNGKADYTVSGEAEVSVLDSRGLEGFASFRARLAIELREGLEGKVISERSLEASAIDLSGRVAAAKALEKAGRLAGEKLTSDLKGARRELAELIQEE